MCSRLQDCGDKVVMAGVDIDNVQVFDACFDCMGAVGQLLPGVGWADACGKCLGRLWLFRTKFHKRSKKYKYVVYSI